MRTLKFHHFGFLLFLLFWNMPAYGGSDISKEYHAAWRGAAGLFPEAELQKYRVLIVKGFLTDAMSRFSEGLPQEFLGSAHFSDQQVLFSLLYQKLKKENEFCTCHPAL